MSHCSRRRVISRLPDQQKGVVLIVALIMLLLMTIVGLASVRGSGMQELMAGNMRDQQISFQSTEAGLRSGEQAANGTPTGVGFFATEIVGGGSTNYWLTHTWGGGSPQAFVSPVQVNLAAEAPKYAIESIVVDQVPGSDGGAVGFLGVQNSPVHLRFYRVTARGVGMSANSPSMVQSIYRAE